MIRGKQIWGTTRYFIKIDPTSNLFNTSLGGTVSFYDTRGIIEERVCKNLHQLVRTVFEFWATILAPHESRVARWLEEYFAEMGIVSDYRLILKLLRSEELLEKPISELIGESVELPKAPYIKVLAVPEDSNVLAKKITILQYPEDDYGLNELIQKVIDQNKISEPDRIKRVIKYQIGAEDVVKEEELNIEIGEYLGIYKINCDFENTYNEPITDIVVEEILPYSYKVVNIESSHEYHTEAKITDDGYTLVLKFNELQANEKLTIKCSLSKRINRTIVETYKDHLNIIFTYMDINQKGLNFHASLKYRNSSTSTISQLFFIDEIPPEYKILRTDPDAIPPQGIIETVKMKGSTIRWRYKNIRPNFAIEHTYELDYYPYIFKYLKLIRTKDNTDILKCVKIIRPLQKESGYKIMFAIKSLATVNETISISDTLPENHAVVSSFPAEEQLLETMGDDGSKIITWVTEVPDIYKQTQLEIHVSTPGQVTFGPFSVQIGSMKETKIIEKTTTMQRDLISES